MDDLKPCPMCGNAGEIIKREYQSNYNNPPLLGYAPRCITITDCIAHEWDYLFDTEEDAVEAWNTRTPPPGYALVNLEGAEERVARALREQTKKFRKTFYEIKNGEPPPEEENSWMMERPWAQAAIKALTEGE